MEKRTADFSFRTRKKSIEDFQKDTFDFLIIGGGISGAAVARDAASRGLKVALIEKNDFAFGTSSRSSKLVHGGLRYLKSLEFSLVHEALTERSYLLEAVPNLVRPIPFYFPVYDEDEASATQVSLGLWLYDLLAFFRTPEFHKRLSKKEFLAQLPELSSEGLQCGFRYYDALMWDDVLVLETLRSAHHFGAKSANYVEAIEPIWESGRMVGFKARDLEAGKDSACFSIRAHQTILCAGPWTDELGLRMSSDWERWLTPSKGVHLIFDLKKIPVPGAVVMNNADDGRVAFVIPRKDYGNGVVIVGTTDGPTPDDPTQAKVSSDEVDYLLLLLKRYFPGISLSEKDILSAYVGVRPLMNAKREAHVPSPNRKKRKFRLRQKQQQETSEGSSVLQKVSREHHIGNGPGECVVVAGGKYTTHRQMAKEIVEFTLKNWKKLQSQGVSGLPEVPKVRASQVDLPLNQNTTREQIRLTQERLDSQGRVLPESLVLRYGQDVFDFHEERESLLQDPDGFPYLEDQLRYSICYEMIHHLDDFYLRRVPLFMTRKDHGLPWAERLSRVLALELGLSEDQRRSEIARLKAEVLKSEAWRRNPYSVPSAENESLS